MQLYLLRPMRKPKTSPRAMRAAARLTAKGIEAGAARGALLPRKHDVTADAHPAQPRSSGTGSNGRRYVAELTGSPLIAGAVGSRRACRPGTRESRQLKAHRSEKEADARPVTRPDFSQIISLLLGACPSATQVHIRKSLAHTRLVIDRLPRGGAASLGNGPPAHARLIVNPTGPTVPPTDQLCRRSRRADSQPGRARRFAARGIFRIAPRRRQNTPRAPWHQAMGPRIPAAPTGPLADHFWR